MADVNIVIYVNSLYDLDWNDVQCVFNAGADNCGSKMVDFKGNNFFVAFKPKDASKEDVLKALALEWGDDDGDDSNDDD